MFVNSEYMYHVLIGLVCRYVFTLEHEPYMQEKLAKRPLAMTLLFSLRLQVTKIEYLTLFKNSICI